MLKFTRKKLTKDIIAQARAQGVAVDDYHYRKHGADYIALGRARDKRPDGSPVVTCDDHGCVMYSTFDGRFWGRTDKGVQFTSDSSKHDKQPWMRALLRFFYVEKK